jgi:ubiquinone/menaquinone biosynthesis C-methylase UbiE
MHSNSGWSNASALSTDEVAGMAAHLEDRARRADQLQANLALCDTLDLQPGERLLEVGCGSGVLCRLVAGRAIPGSRITGLDGAVEFLRAAQQQAGETRPAQSISLLAGRAEALPCRSASFDAGLAARLLLHVADPVAVLREMRRVVRPGGRLVLMDWDFGTTAVDHPNRALTRRIIGWRCDHHGGDGWSGRQLWKWSQAAGLRNVEIFPVTCIATDEEQALTLSLWRAAQAARDAGEISAGEHDAWVNTLKEKLAGGSFFASIVYFIARGWR